jgi:hypothetical protein
MNFVQLRSYDNYVNANMQLSILKAEDIQCYLKDEFTLTVDPGLSPGLGGMKLMVDELQFTTAQKILDDCDRKYLETIACPNCHAHTLSQVVQIKEPAGFFERLKFMVVNGQARAVKKFYQCGSCGVKMEDLPIEQ